jgi:hypothetical protein
MSEVSLPVALRTKLPDKMFKNGTAVKNTTAKISLLEELCILAE